MESAEPSTDSQVVRTPEMPNVLPVEVTITEKLSIQPSSMETSDESEAQIVQKHAVASDPLTMDSAEPSTDSQVVRIPEESNVVPVEVAITEKLSIQPSSMEISDESEAQNLQKNAVTSDTPEMPNVLLVEVAITEKLTIQPEAQIFQNNAVASDPLTMDSAVPSMDSQVVRTPEKPNVFPVNVVITEKLTIQPSEEIVDQPEAHTLQNNAVTSGTPEKSNVLPVEVAITEPSSMEIGDESEAQILQNKAVTSEPLILTPCNNSLSLLAAYSSDSSDSSDSSSEEDEDESSSDDESSSSESSSSSSASSSASERFMAEMEKAIAELDDDEEVDITKRPPPKVLGELDLDDLPPIEKLEISVPEGDCLLLGKVASIVDRLVMVESLPGRAPVDLDSVLFLEKGHTTLGRVFDVIGPVSCPIYCVRFNSVEEIAGKSIVVGSDVFVAPKANCTNFVILPKLLKEKGSDASWKNDIEPPDNKLDFSDDEQERGARKGKKPTGQNGSVEGGVEVRRAPRPPRFIPQRSPQFARPIHSYQHQQQHPMMPPQMQNFNYGYQNPYYVNPYANPYVPMHPMNYYHPPPPPPPPGM